MRGRKGKDHTVPWKPGCLCYGYSPCKLYDYIHVKGPLHVRMLEHLVPKWGRCFRRL